MSETKPEVRFEPGPLTERESQIVSVLVTLQTQVLQAPFVAAGHVLTPEQERHIADDVALMMTAALPDIHFFVEQMAQPDRPKGPEFPR